VVALLLVLVLPPAEVLPLAEALLFVVPSLAVEAPVVDAAPVRAEDAVVETPMVTEALEPVDCRVVDVSRPLDCARVVVPRAPLVPVVAASAELPASLTPAVLPQPPVTARHRTADSEDGTKKILMA
jgi:hypothetical protein